MTTLQIRDSVIWLKHLAGPMRDWLSTAPAGTPVTLEIEGVALAFRKMADGADGRPTLGLRPVDPAAWARFWPQRRGEVVEVRDTAETPRRASAAFVARLEAELADVVLGEGDAATLIDEVRAGPQL